MQETPKKKGRGRPKGSTSFARVNINHLQDQVGHNATIVVSKKWMEEVGVVVTPAPVKTIAAQVTEEREEKVQFAVHSFE